MKSSVVKHVPQWKDPDTAIELFREEQIDQKRCECLNASDSHTLRDMIINSKSLVERANTDNYLESKMDEQMLIFLPFKKKFNLKSIRIYAPNDEHCPKVLRLYANVPQGIDFDSIETMKAQQEIILSGEEASAEPVQPIVLKAMNFRNVSSLIIYVKDNHGANTSVIYKMKLLGTPVEDKSKEQLKKVTSTTQ
jgi:hypothetical protein